MTSSGRCGFLFRSPPDDEFPGRVSAYVAPPSALPCTPRELSRRGDVAMWMRVSRARIDPARLDEASTLLEDVGEALRQLPGVQRYLLGVDRATGQLISVSTFDTEEHANWAPTREDLNARIQALGIQADPPEIFEVTTRA